MEHKLIAWYSKCCYLRDVINCVLQHFKKYLHLYVFAFQTVTINKRWYKAIDFDYGHTGHQPQK